MLVVQLNVLCLLFIGVYAASTKEEPLPKELQDGLKAGDKFLDALHALDEEEVDEVASELTELTVPFIQALSTLVRESQTLQEEKPRKRMVDLLKHYNSRLRVMSYEYTEVRNLIDWSTVSLSFGQYERSILALKENMMQVLQAPAANQEGHKFLFRKLFESDYNNAATKLYQGLTNKDSLFSENLIHAVRKYTKNHRLLTKQFCLGVYKLIMEGIELEATYLTFSDLSAGIDFVRTYWGQRLEELQRLIQATDYDIRESWKVQAEVDVEEYMKAHVAHADLPNYETGSMYDFSFSLYSFLSKKYDWRHWMVLVTRPLQVKSQFAYLDCPQVIFREGNQNVLVSSVDKSNSTFGVRETKQLLDSLRTYVPLRQSEKPQFFLNEILNTINRTNEEICRYFAFIGVINHEEGVQWSKAPYHAVDGMRTLNSILFSYDYNVFFFG